MRRYPLSRLVVFTLIAALAAWLAWQLPPGFLP